MKFQKNYVLITFLMINTFIQAQPEAIVSLLSPPSKVSQRIGITDIDINYSRPKVKGRAIWGNLVPYGYNHPNAIKRDNSSPWRAGAENTTTISFSDDVMINKKLITEGVYSLFISVFEDNTAEIIINNAPQQFGSFFIKTNLILLE